jgi:excinuclease ABC subunit B
MSPAMRASIQQTLERRERQHASNEANGVVPKTIEKALPKMNSDIDDLIAGTSTSKDGTRRLIAKKGGRKEGDWAQKLNLGAGAWASGDGQDGSSGEHSNNSIEKSNIQLTYDEPDDVLSGLEPSQIQDLLGELRSAMKEAAKNLDFEEAARLRDRVFELEQRL